MDAPFCYVVVHKACKERPGVLASQIWHAARECLLFGRFNYRAEDGQTYVMHTATPPTETERVCVLEATSSADLRALSEALTAAGVHHKLLLEPDAPWNGAATAVGIDACDRAKVKPLVAQFQLLR